MASPNAITFASLTNLTVAASIDTNFVLLLSERNALPMHPALLFTDPIDRAASNVKQVGHLGLQSFDLPQTVADGATVGNTALSTGQTQITVERQSMARSMTDLARMVQPDGRLSPAAVAMDQVSSHASQLTALIADVVDGFAATGGPGSGNDLDVVSVMAIIGAGRVNNLQSGSYMGLLHGQQWGDLIVDAGTSIGAGGMGTQQFNPQLAALQFLRGGSFVGSWLGVDWFSNNRVVTANAGADRAGALFAFGGVMIGQGLFTGVVDDPTNQLLIGGTTSQGGTTGSLVLLERERDAYAGETGWVSHSYMGVSLGIEAGITIISDA